jgi:hypothetical protein
MNVRGVSFFVLVSLILEELLLYDYLLLSFIWLRLYPTLVQWYGYI